MEILYQDRRIVVCVKPVGVLSTDEPGGLPDLLRAELGTDCLRTVHRLDQVVGGVMVLARSREAARLLSVQVAGDDFRKEYLAVVHHAPAQPAGRWEDLLQRSKSEHKTYVVPQSGRDVYPASLRYEVLSVRDDRSLVRIQLETGRTHQIRAQFSSRGLPLVGDRKYGAPEADFPGIALWSHAVAFRHPQTDEPMHFSALPEGAPWDAFADVIHGEI